MTNFMNFWCVRGGGEEGCLGQGPVWAMSSPCRGLRVRWEQGRGQRKEASLRGQGREPGCVGRWKPWGAEAEHVSKPGAFPVCRQAQGQCFHELEIGTSMTLFLCGFTLRSEGACPVRDPRSLFMCCVFFYVTSCSIWWYSIHRGHIAVTSQTYFSQEPLFRLQSFWPAMWLDVFRSRFSSLCLCISNVHIPGEWEEAGKGQFLLFPLRQRSDCSPSPHSSLSNLTCTKPGSKRQGEGSS